MAYLKVKSSAYHKESDVINATYYVLDVQKCTHQICFAKNFICCFPLISPDVISSQFIAIQNAYSSPYRHRIYHIIYSLDDETNFPLQAALSTGIAIQNLYYKYQSIFAVHEDKENIHLHLLISNIAVAGNMLLSSILNMDHIESLANCILDEYWRYELTHSFSRPNPIILARDGYSRFIRQ